MLKFCQVLRYLVFLYLEGRDLIDAFNSKHLAFVLIGTTIVSLKTYPTVFTRVGGRDTWIAFIGASILIFLYILFLLRVFQKGNTTSLYKIYSLALGKGMGTFFLMTFAFTLFVTLIESAAVEASSMHTNMLLDTPVWFIALFFIPPALYTTKKGKSAIMIVTLIAMALVTVSGINLSILTVKYKRPEFLKPILVNGITWDLIKCMVQVLGVYGCATIFLPYLKDIRDRKKLIFFQVLALIFIIQMQIVSITGVQMTFELSVLNTMYYPKLLQTQLVDYFRFLESGELFVMLQIVGGWYIKYVLTFYALIMVLKEMQIKIKYLMYFVSIVVYVVASVAARNIWELFDFLHYYSYIALVGFVILPFFVFAIYAAKGYPSKSKE